MTGYPFLELGIKLFLLLPSGCIRGHTRGESGRDAGAKSPVSILGSVAFVDQQNGGMGVRSVLDTDGQSLEREI